MNEQELPKGLDEVMGTPGTGGGPGTHSVGTQ